MKKLMTLSLFLVIAAFPSVLIAGDYAQLRFIGFSKNAKYLAFEEFGVGHSTIFFVDTGKNDYAAPPITSVIEEPESDSDVESPDYSFDSAARRRTLLKAAHVLRRLGIITGNTGRQVISRLLTDVTDEDAPPYEPKSVAFAPDRRQSMLNGRFYLTLNTVSQNQLCKAADDPELVKYVGVNGLPIPRIRENPHRKTSNKEKQKLYSFELSLKSGDADKTRVLQKAFAKPVNRGCTIDYRIQSVHLYKNQIAVFVGVFTPAFLGDDIRLMVVTGKIGDE